MRHNRSKATKATAAKRPSCGYLHTYNIHTCLKWAFVCVCVSEVYRSCLCVIICWCACVCVGIYLQLSGRLCLASHMNLIYACACACVYVCLGTVHKSEYIAIGTITHTHTQLHVQAALQLSSLCYIARCRVQLTDCIKRETREIEGEGERRHLPVRKQLCTGVCVRVCVCNTLLKVQCDWRFRWAHYLFSQR